VIEDVDEFFSVVSSLSENVVDGDDDDDDVDVFFECPSPMSLSLAPNGVPTPCWVEYVM
jgi:hypothetical protein